MLAKKVVESQGVAHRKAIMSEIVVTKHAKRRLIERRGVKRLDRHIRKIQKWNLPADGITIHGGWRYITSGGALLTVLPPKWSELKKQGYKTLKDMEELHEIVT